MKIEGHRELDVYKKSFRVAMEIFELSKSFPREETYSLTDQMRRSSRSVAANIAEAWRKRRYKAAFISKLSDAEGETAETQVWVEFALSCGYISRDQAKSLYAELNEVTRMIVSMIAHADKWCFVIKS